MKFEVVFEVEVSREDNESVNSMKAYVEDLASEWLAPGIKYSVRPVPKEVTPDSIDQRQMYFDIDAAFRDETWFSCHLFRLIDKADMQNKARLRKGFPEHVLAYEMWERGELNAGVHDSAV